MNNLLKILKERINFPSLIKGGKTDPYRPCIQSPSRTVRLRCAVKSYTDRNFPPPQRLCHQLTVILGTYK